MQRRCPHAASHRHLLWHKRRDLGLSPAALPGFPKAEVDSGIPGIYATPWVYFVAKVKLSIDGLWTGQAAFAQLLSLKK